MLLKLFMTALPAFLACQQTLLLTQREARKLHCSEADSKLSAACEGYFRARVFQRSIV